MWEAVAQDPKGTSQPTHDHAGDQRDDSTIVRMRAAVLVHVGAPATLDPNIATLSTRRTISLCGPPVGLLNSKFKRCLFLGLLDCRMIRICKLFVI
ncbi:MAG TPA: hypothetical protein VLM79_23000 [Kofleriaceae bacterium]|nr:hypothetical protein [Kofleriaceae bacterium]